MRNATNKELKKCIFKIQDDFENDVQQAFGKTINFMYSWEGVICEYDDEEEPDIKDEELCSKLSEYYDVNVTSVHIDDCDLIGVWIVYKDNADEEQIFRKVKHEYDKLDVKMILTEDYLSELNDEEVDEFFKRFNLDNVVAVYQYKSDANYGVWDNIRATLDNYKNNINLIIESVKK